MLVPSKVGDSGNPRTIDARLHAQPYLQRSPDLKDLALDSQLSLFMSGERA